MARYLILAIALIVMIGIYVFFRLRWLLGFYGMDVKKKGFLALNVFLTAGICFLCMNLFRTSGVLALHIAVLFFILDLAALLARTLYGKRKRGKCFAFCKKAYQSGILSILLTAVVFSYGYYNMNHIRQTYYQVSTDKQIGQYRIALLTDIHYDTVQDAEILKNKLEEVNAQQPDLVILGGDIVEEGTSKERMQEVFQLLGGLESRYGVYYVYGNHDRQPYTNRRTYTDEELAQAIESCGIQILEDAYAEIGDELILAGRGDAAWGATRQRALVGEILKGADRGKFIIMADHQPIEAEENNAQGVDLLLSGHTHGGQIWPMGIVSELMGILNYGRYRQNGCTVIVSSGVAGWAYTIRTGEHCEYVIVDIGRE